MLNTDFIYFLLLKTIFLFAWSFILLNDDASVKRVKKCGKFSSSYLALSTLSFVENKINAAR